MPRSKNPVPSYSLHKPTGQAYVRIPDGAGGRRVVYLGKHGSPECQAEYRRILAEMQIVATWLAVGAVTETRLAGYSEYARTSDPRRPARGKCAVCGQVLSVPLARLLDPIV